jgi:hypothetical protein
LPNQSAFCYNIIIGKQKYFPHTLTMQRTAGRSALPLSMTSTFNPQPCAPSPAIDRSSDNRRQINEEAVFVTGSLIPQRIKLKRIGTMTVSPIRIIDRREIDGTGRLTTRGVLIADPSVRAVGH